MIEIKGAAQSEFQPRRSTEFLDRSGEGKLKIASEFDQQPNTGVADWVDVVKLGLANSMCVVGKASPGESSRCSPSNQVSLRFE